MLKHMELCVSLRRPHMAKDALFQYKTLTQQVFYKIRRAFLFIFYFRHAINEIAVFQVKFWPKSCFKIDTVDFFIENRYWSASIKSFQKWGKVFCVEEFQISYIFLKIL